MTSSLGLWMVARRLAQLVPVVIGVSIATFVLLNVLPGDQAVALLGPDAPPEVLAATRAELGLDRPLAVQYVDWATDVARGDLGTSVRSGRPVSELILDRLPATLEILVAAQVIALGIAVPVACLAAWRRNSALDRLTSTAAIGAVAMPNFFFGVVLVLVFAVKLRWLPASGFSPIGDGVGANLRSVVLPACTLALGECAVYLRVLRAEMISQIDAEHMTASLARGSSPASAIRRHALRNSMLPLITVVGLNVGTLIGGAVIVERIFAIPGLGGLLLEGVSTRDLSVVQGLVFVVAVGYVVVNLGVDLLYAAFDPRVRDGYRLA